MTKTKIEYLSHTWNPLAMRCTPCSEGCTDCWHIRYADRLCKNTGIASDKRAAYAGGTPVFDIKELDAPLRRRKPAKIGVQFMGDLFHSDVRDWMIDEIMNVIVNCPQHTFFLLTKRIDRAINYYISCNLSAGFPNIWFGITIENQKRADERIPELLKLRKYFPVLFLSVEPMLSEIDLIQSCDVVIREDDSWEVPAVDGIDKWLDFVICGAETGPGARPMNPQWARDLLQQCREADIPFFMKAMSGGQPISGDLMVREWPR